MVKKSGGDCHLQARGSTRHKLRDLRGREAVACPVSLHRGQALSWARGPEAKGAVSLELPEMPHRELEDVSLLQLRDTLPVLLEGGYHQVLELVQTPVDPRPPLPLEQRLDHVAILVGPGHRGLLRQLRGGLAVNATVTGRHFRETGHSVMFKRYWRHFKRS